VYSEYNAANAGEEEEAPDTFAGLQKQGYARPAPMPSAETLYGGGQGPETPPPAPSIDMYGGTKAAPPQGADSPPPNPYTPAPPPPPAASGGGSASGGQSYAPSNPEEVSYGGPAPQSAEAYNAQYATGGINLNQQVANTSAAPNNPNTPTPTGGAAPARRAGSTTRSCRSS